MATQETQTTLTKGRTDTSYLPCQVSFFLFDGKSPKGSSKRLNYITFTQYQWKTETIDKNQTDDQQRHDDKMTRTYLGRMR